MATKESSTVQGKNADKRYCINLTWIYKRLTWETTLSEKEITKKFGKEISDKLKAGMSNTEICKEIRRKIFAG